MAEALQDLGVFVKAGSAARFSYTTKWSPQRLLNISVEAKKRYEFSFRVMTGAELVGAVPKVEFLVAGYSWPLWTLFLDNIKVDSINEYPFQLWWARGIKNKNTLQNAKLAIENIDATFAGGSEVVECSWVSCKVGGGSFKAIPTAGLLLGDIPCDSYLDITLRIVCRDCSLTRGLVLFNLYIKGDYKEPVYGGPVVFGDGSRYYAGAGDDYVLAPVVSRLQVIV